MMEGRVGLSLEMTGRGGAVYGPAAGGGLPGVVVLHGAEGPGAGWSHRFAAILAAHGLLALPLAYGEGDLFGAGRIEGVDLGEIPAAGRALAAHERCAGRVGLFGWSKGGEAAMLVAALAPAPFACAAAHAAPSQVTAAFDPSAFRSGGGISRVPDAPRAWVWAGHEDDLVPGRPIPVERAAVPLFLSSGTADAVVPHADTLAMARRLEAAGSPADLFVAEGQGHGLDFGVEPALWARLAAFLRRHLG
jgi:dipeptidyl aminopeptidase/acylaminoacyl peptidase